MNVPAPILPFLAGIALGGFYFYGLWWTVQRLNSRYAALLMPGSFLVRVAVVVTGFYIVMDGRWQALLAALTGFIAVRIVIVSRLKKEAG